MAALPSVMPTCPATFHNTTDVRSSAAAPPAGAHTSAVRSETRMITDRAAIFRRHAITTCRQKPGLPTGAMTSRLQRPRLSGPRPGQIRPQRPLLHTVGRSERKQQQTTPRPSISAALLPTLGPGRAAHPLPNCHELANGRLRAQAGDSGRRNHGTTCTTERTAPDGDGDGVPDDGRRAVWLREFPDHARVPAHARADAGVENRRLQRPDVQLLDIRRP